MLSTIEMKKYIDSPVNLVNESQCKVLFYYILNVFIQLKCKHIQAELKLDQCIYKN